MDEKLPHPKLYYAAATGFGALLPLGFAPFGFSLLPILSLIGLLAIWQKADRRQSLVSGWFFGIGLYAVGASWVFISIYVYSATPLPFAIILTALFVLIMGFISAIQGYFFHLLGLNKMALLGFPALWVVFEWVKTWLFTGFPWLYLGYAMMDTPLEGFAPITGIFGISFITAFGAALCFILLQQIVQRTPRLKWAALSTGFYFIAIPVTGSFLLETAWTEKTSETPLSVSIIQGNIPQETKWDLNFRDAILNLYQERTEASWGSDLIIWPEAAVPAFEHEVSDYLNTIHQRAQDQGSSLIMGLAIMHYLSEGELLFYNSIRSMGQGSGLYHKQRLVPFGEFVPFEDQLRGLTGAFNLPMSSFTRGDANQAPLLAGKHSIYPYICYEILFPDLVARTSQHAEILVTISNDGWFGHSAGPAQHFEMARMRALETGRYLIRATNNGISAIVNPKGKVTHLAPSFVETTLNGEVYPMQGSTPFMDWGSRPILILATLILLGFVVLSIKQKILRDPALQTEQEPDPR